MLRLLKIRGIYYTIIIVLGLSAFVIGISFFHRGTLWYYLFMLLYGLSIGLLVYETGKKSGIKKAKKPVIIITLISVAASFVIAGLVFFAVYLLYLDKSAIKWSVVGTFLISGILTLTYTIYTLKKNKQ